MTAIDNGTNRRQPTALRRTACRICAVGCGILVETDGDDVVRIHGDPDDPVTHGFTCSKGRAGVAFHSAPNRLERPLVRRGGRLVETDWDEALADIAAVTRALVDEHGPHVIADYVGTGGPLDPAGYAMAHGFFRALGTTQHYSALSIDCSGKQLIPQLVSGVQLMFQPDLDHTALLLAFGVNTVVSHGHGVMLAEPLVRLRQLKARGGRLVVIDPRTSETANHADLHVQLRPGSDPALLAHLVREALRHGGDATYLDACADPEGVERLAQAVGRFDLDTAATICDVPKTVVASLADMVLAAGRVAVETGTGTTMNRSSTLTEWLVWALSAVTGSLDRVGGATFNPGFLRPFEDALPSGRGDLEPRPASRPDVPRIANGEMPCVALADEIDARNVRALFVRVGNPALAFPDNGRLRRSLAELDLCVAIDVHPTATTDVATHVLPMTDHFERGDLVTGYLRATPFARYAPPVVAARGERRQQWWIFAELSRRLGLPLFGSKRRDADLAGRPLDDEIVAESTMAGARRPWEEVRAAEHGVEDTSIEPGWLIPGRLPRSLDVAPADLVGDLARWTPPNAPGLVLVNRRTGEGYNSFTITDVDAALLIHPRDASDVGVTDGEVVVVRTASGCCEAVARVTDAIRPGVVSLPHCRPGSDVNQLTSTWEFDRRSAMPVLSGFPVTIEPSCSM